MKLAIVGGGWAGLSAAVTALELGHDVHLYEAASRLGGRARSVQGTVLNDVDACIGKPADNDPAHKDASGTPFPSDIDNGQHILLGAYSATLSLMRRLGLDPEQRLGRQPLNVHSADGSVSLRCPRALPAPFNVALGFLGAKGLRVTEKWAAIRAMRSLKRDEWRTAAGATVQQWLTRQRQPERLQILLWHPLCIATLNTPPDKACAQLFANVLRDSLGSADRAASDILLPRLSLSALWPDSVGTYSSATGSRIKIRVSTTIKRLSCGPAVQTAGTTMPVQASSHRDCRAIVLDDLPEPYDAVIIAGNAPSSARLLNTLPSVDGSATLIRALQQFQYAPIATLTLQLARPWPLPSPMLMLLEDRSRTHYGQWLFQGQNPLENLVHIVVSDAHDLAERPREQVVHALIEQLGEQVKAAPMPPVLRHALIVEKRATFLAVPDLKRPGHRTPWPRVWLAGDWTDTGYPAVLEGAVRSGHSAALQLHAQFSER